MDNFQLYMFDFDGLLVDTEWCHYEAYRRVLARRGFELPWDFEVYTQYAHYSHDGLQVEMYRLFPLLYQQEPDWKVIHKEKSKEIITIYREGSVQLMPGVERMLKTLADRDISRTVVTHSAMELVSILVEQHPILQTIPHWITREDYTKPKPDPECYQVAIKRFIEPHQKAIGFEDSIRGISALRDSGAYPVLVTRMQYPEIPEMVSQGVKHLQTFDEWVFPQI